MRADGRWVRVDKFEKLDRYREHDVEVALAEICPKKKGFAIELAGVEVPLGGSGSSALCVWARTPASPSPSATRRRPPGFPPAAPIRCDRRSLSPNSIQRAFPGIPRAGGVRSAGVTGAIFNWMNSDERFEDVPDDVGDGEPCPACRRHPPERNRPRGVLGFSTTAHA